MPSLPTLQGMFAGDASAVTKEEDGATVIDTSVTGKDTDADADSSSSTDKDTAASDKKETLPPPPPSSSSSSSQGALFVNEPDAFQ